MFKTTIHLILGLFLSGCTFDNSRHTSWLHSVPLANESIVVINQKTNKDAPESGVLVDIEKEQVNKPIIGCEIYTPLTLPALVRIDLDESRKATYERSMEMLGENIEAIHKQMAEFRSLSRNHFSAWRKRCNK
jgi:hypothetical protein